MLDEDPYLVFLRGKIEVAPCLGFDVDPEEINPILKPHQRDIVRWAVRGGCREAMPHQSRCGVCAEQQQDINARRRAAA